MKILKTRKGVELPIDLWWKIFWLFIMLAAAGMIYLIVEKGSWGYIGKIISVFTNLPALIFGM